MLPYVTIHLHFLHLVAVHYLFISPIPYISLGRKIHLASDFFQLMGEGEILFVIFTWFHPPFYASLWHMCLKHFPICQKFSTNQFKTFEPCFEIFYCFPRIKNKLFILKPISKSKYLGYRVIEGSWYLTYCFLILITHLLLGFLPNLGRLESGTRQTTREAMQLAGVKMPMSLLSLSGNGGSGINNGVFIPHCHIKFQWTGHFILPFSIARDGFVSNKMKYILFLLKACYNVLFHWKLNDKSKFRLKLLIIKFSS